MLLSSIRHVVKADHAEATWPGNLNTMGLSRAVNWQLMPTKHDLDVFHGACLPPARYHVAMMPATMPSSSINCGCVPFVSPSSPCFWLRRACDTT